MSDFKGASGGRDGIDKGLFLGYTPGGSQKFSWSIEGYINDAGIANMANELGDMDAYTYYKSRAPQTMSTSSATETELKTNGLRPRMRMAPGPDPKWIRLRSMMITRKLRL